ncbi:MAG: hypothetical protein ABSC51_10330 [Gaiellaceae bacterium]|jgi:hypothetical protein
MSLDKLSMGRRILLGSAVVLLIWSFFPWNGFSLGGFGITVVSVSWNAWHGAGIFMGILLIALIAWEVVLLMPDTIKLPELPVKPMLISLALGALTVILGIWRVFEYGARKWEIWIALILIAALAVGAFLRFQEEGGTAATK